MATEAGRGRGLRGSAHKCLPGRALRRTAAGAPRRDRGPADADPRRYRGDRGTQLNPGGSMSVAFEYGTPALGRLPLVSGGDAWHVLAWHGGRAVSVGRLETHPDGMFAGLYGGGTLASHRGRGFYRAMVAARARDAIELGARYLMVDALPTSRPILERLGFVRLTDSWPCIWRPDERGAGS